MRLTRCDNLDCESVVADYETERTPRWVHLRKGIYASDSIDLEFCGWGCVAAYARMKADIAVDQQEKAPVVAAA